MKISKQFYTKIKPEWLAKRKSINKSKKEISYLKKIISKELKILDLWCGYGRITIPLAKEGYNICGIDITLSLIRKAIENTKLQGLKIDFQLGDMRRLPYKGESFDTVLCLWDSFLHHYKKEDQIKALKEMLRVLAPNEPIFIDLPIKLNAGNVKDMKKANIMFTKWKESHVLIFNLRKIGETLVYNHNEETLKALGRPLNLSKYRIFIDKFDGRERRILKIWK